MMLKLKDNVIKEAKIYTYKNVLIIVNYKINHNLYVQFYF